MSTYTGSDDEEAWFLDDSFYGICGDTRKEYAGSPFPFRPLTLFWYLYGKFMRTPWKEFWRELLRSTYEDGRRIENELNIRLHTWHWGRWDKKDRWRWWKHFIADVTYGMLHSSNCPNCGSSRWGDHDGDDDQIVYRSSGGYSDEGWCAFWRTCPRCWHYELMSE